MLSETKNSTFYLFFSYDVVPSELQSDAQWCFSTFVTR